MDPTLVLAWETRWSNVPPFVWTTVYILDDMVSVISLAGPPNQSPIGTQDIFGILWPKLSSLSFPLHDLSVAHRLRESASVLLACLRTQSRI
jgi:hypothetical protein